MRPTTKTRAMVVGGSLAATLVLASCTTNANPTETTPTPTTTTTTNTIDITNGERPNADVITLAEGSSAADVDAAIARAVDQLPSLAQKGLDLSGVPGMAIAVVHDGEMVYAEGFGVRKAGQPEKIDPETVFQIASISKSISATTVAKAVTNTDLSWDTPVVDSLPDFSLKDTFATENATVGDYFSHRVGLATGAGDDLEDIGYDREYILNHLNLQPLMPFRSTYQYSNFGITVAAQAIAAALDTTWEDLIDELTFEPIGMTSSSARHDDFLAQENRASTHILINDTFEALFERNPDPQSPAGGVSSNVIDMAKWMNMVLAQGELKNATYINSADILAATTGQMVTGAGPSPEGRTGLYGYGFNVGTQVGGRTSLSHSGGFILGAGTNYQIIPSLDLGIVTLTNGGPVGVAEAVNAEFLDLVQYGQTHRDWFTDFRGALGGLFIPAGDLVGEEPPSDATPAAPVDEYTGTFTNDYFGDLIVTEVDGALIGALGPRSDYIFELTPWSGDTFAFIPTGENAPPGSLSSAIFDRTSDEVIEVTLDYFNSQGLGTWSRIQ